MISVVLPANFGELIAQAAPIIDRSNYRRVLASIEVELPDGLNSEKLNGKIHETFALVRNSVEAELPGATLMIGINSSALRNASARLAVCRLTVLRCPST